MSVKEIVKKIFLEDIEMDINTLVRKVWEKDPDINVNSITRLYSEYKNTKYVKVTIPTEIATHKKIILKDLIRLGSNIDRKCLRKYGFEPFEIDIIKQANPNLDIE